MSYKRVLKEYGYARLECASESDIQMVQRFQNKVLSGTINTPWHLRNSDLHRDLGIEMISHLYVYYKHTS